jgi:DNA gyrase subunit A
LKDYRLTGRGAKGVINMKITPKIGKVVEVLPVQENTDLMVITRNGQIIRLDSDTIRETGRSAQGVRVVKMAEDDKVAAACIVPEAVEDDDKGPELPLQ